MKNSANGVERLQNADTCLIRETMHGCCRAGAPCVRVLTKAAGTATVSFINHFPTMFFGGSMTVVGFNFTKMMVERKSAAKGKINIQNNISLKDVDAANLALGKAKQDALRFTFEFTSHYEPDAGSIQLVGELIDIVDEKSYAETLDEWKKKKRVPQAVMSRILNTVLNKCNVQALILSNSINLPPPVPMPRVNIQEEMAQERKEEKKGKKE